MKTLTAMDFLSSYSDILTDGISVPDYLRPKCIQKFTSVDLVKTYNKLRWLDYVELPQEANKESFLKFITLVGMIREREGEGVHIDLDALPLIKEIIGSDDPRCYEEMYYASYLLHVDMIDPTVCIKSGVVTDPAFCRKGGIIIPSILPSFLQERNATIEGFAGNFDRAWDYLLKRYPQSYKVRTNIRGSMKEKESIRLFSLKHRPLSELSLVLPSNYGEDDYLEVRTYTYCLDEFMGRSYD